MVNSVYALRPRAQRDLEEIGDFTVQGWSIAQAEPYLRQIRGHRRVFPKSYAKEKDISFQLDRYRTMKRGRA